jgi:hypothetical protein
MTLLGRTDVGIHTDNDLTFGVDAPLGTVTRVGDLVIIRTEDPVGVWDAVTTSVSTGQRAVSAVAEELAAQGVTVEITGPDGLVARLGAGIDSSRGLLAAGSRKMELGDRHATASLVRARLRRADPRVGAAATGAVLAGGAVVFGVRRRRRRKSGWEARRDQAGAAVSAAVAEVATRGRDALPVLVAGYEQVRDAALPKAVSAAEQARDVALPKVISAVEHARDVAVPVAISAFDQAREAAGPQATSAFEQARDAWQRAAVNDRVDAARAAVEPRIAAARKAAEPRVQAAVKAAQPVLEDAAARGRVLAGQAREYAVNDAVPLAQDLAHRAKELADQAQARAKAKATATKKCRKRWHFWH